MPLGPLTPSLAGRFASIALGHVTREYPNKLDHVLNGPTDLEGPRALHPIFYGSFDWHSCVHGYWLLSTLYRRFSGRPEAGAIRALFDEHLTPAKTAGELAYLDRPLSGMFERPYGWAWLLKLAAELGTHETEEGRRWSAALAPLARAFAARFGTFLPKATYPNRAGTHANSAFALRLALDYAEAADAALAALLRDTARRWYGEDADCQAWEPSGEDFLSSALIEAECMRRILPPDAFAGWLDRFLPRLGRGEPATLFRPATVSDHSDGKIGHLNGLNLSRAWCWRGLARALPTEDPRREMALAAAEAHFAAGLPQVAGDYMVEHWLASFALLALTET
ncbi:MAG TPA: DUF2891 domain-containing protein [Aliidongia sp.]|nr:DUF2891 domain-containing protein [Aliidongia sp.]